MIAPRPGEHTLRTEDIIDLIHKDKDIALVMLSGIQYYTGQFFEMEKITKAKACIETSCAIHCGEWESYIFVVWKLAPFGNFFEQTSLTAVAK